LLDESRKAEIKKIGAGQNLDTDKPLITSGSLKDGISQVSKFYVNNTLIAEYPNLKTNIQALRGGKSRHSAKSLSEIWKTDEESAKEIAETFGVIGLFKIEVRPDKNNYWIPFLYRHGLDIKQGMAETKQ